MTTVLFETATLADAIKKAARIAPSKGEAFDKAAGLLFTVDPSTPDDYSVTVKATNLDVYYTEWIDTLEVDGAPARWRLPSALVAGIISGLPIGSEKTVRFEQEGRALHITSGRTRARINLIDANYFPGWEPFDPDGLAPVGGLGARITQVEWAASDGQDIPLTGVYFDGKQAIATDRYKLAAVEMVAEMITDPITIPAGILGPVLKQMGDTRVGFSGNQFLLMPDDHTQIRTVIYDQKYPNVGRIMDIKHPATVMFRKTEFINAVTRMLNLVRGDRHPSLKVFIGDGEVAVFMADPQIGDMEDALELPGQCQHEPVELKFGPKNLLDALNASPNEMVTFSYPTDKPGIVYINGGSGYEAWVMPRTGVEAAD